MRNSSARLFTIAGAIAVSIATAAATADNGNPPEKIVLTHVMHQMAVGAVNGRNETHLSVEPTRANGIMAKHTQEYIANYGQPQEAARQELALIKAAGINTIGLLLSNRHLPRSQFAAMIHGYYQAAMIDNSVKIVPDIWGNPNKPEELAEELALIKSSYEKAWRRCDGRLIVMLTLPSLPDYQSTVDKMFAGIGGRKNVYLVLYDPVKLKAKAPEWFKNADAFTDWVHDSYGLDRALLRDAAAAAASAGKPFWSPVMPSFTQSRYPHPGIIPNVREMLGMTWFREAWLAAIKNNAPAAVIQTWNDLSEDSSMMPESNHGYAYYELGKYYVDWFKTGRIPTVKNEQILLFHHPQIVEGVKLPEGRKPMEGFPASHGNRFNNPPVNRTPPTDYIGVVAMLKSPAKVKVMLGETAIAERTLPAGVTSWLIYQPRNLNDPRKLYPCDPDQVYPVPEADFLITRLDKPFYDTEVFVAVERNKQRIGFFRSHRGIAAAAARGELTTIGDVFPLDHNNTPIK